ncbi:hypothetical protein [Ferrovibrio xuzhouensis]|uniref:Uncharacterized protein n=1 Tax=Ferrovibrio xuzhouensis TaxID=1576914 RepID=A0ABV7VF75_9PROT
MARHLLSVVQEALFSTTHRQAVGWAMGERGREVHVAGPADPAAKSAVFDDSHGCAEFPGGNGLAIFHEERMGESRAAVSHFMTARLEVCQSRLNSNGEP